MNKRNFPQFDLLQDQKIIIQSVGVKPINGRMPINAQYAGKVYPASELPMVLRGKYPQGISFTLQGFPDFKRYAVKEVVIQPGKSHGVDFSRADKLAGYSSSNPRPLGYTWHHHEDSGKMQLIPTDIHDYIKHNGGFSKNQK